MGFLPSGLRIDSTAPASSAAARTTVNPNLVVTARVKVTDTAGNNSRVILVPRSAFPAVDQG